MNPLPFPPKGSFEASAARFALSGLVLIGSALGALAYITGFFWWYFGALSIYTGYAALKIMQGFRK